MTKVTQADTDDNNLISIGKLFQTLITLGIIICIQDINDNN